MVFAALASLTLLQAAAPPAISVILDHWSDAVESTSDASGSLLPAHSPAAADAPIPLRFGQTDAWGCLHAASSARYCRHLSVATDGESFLAVDGFPVLRAADGAVYVRCGWALNGGNRPSPCWPPTGLDPAAYTSWLQAQQPTWEEYSMGSKGAILGRQLAEQKARTASPQRPLPTMPGIHPDAPRLQATAGGDGRPAQSSGATRPSGGRSGGQELP